jgi:hypothetical protein
LIEFSAQTKVDQKGSFSPGRKAREKPPITPSLYRCNPALFFVAHRIVAMYNASPHNAPPWVVLE